MSATLYYFTGTGNSLSIAKTIASVLTDSRLVSINGYSTLQQITPYTDIVGIIYPTYFLDAPDPVIQFLNKLSIQSGTYVFLYANCGGSLGNALYTPYFLLQKKGIKVHATYSNVLPDNSIIFPTKLEEQPRLIKDCNTLLKQHLEIIQTKAPTADPKESFATKLAGPAMKLVNHLYLGMDTIQIDASKCTNCNLCTKICSSNNLVAGNSTPQVKNQCSMCFSCIHYCPQEAVRFKRMKTKAGYQYRNPSVDTKELIAARFVI